MANSDFISDEDRDFTPATVYPTQSLGQIMIEDEVIARIAGMAAMDVPGISLGSKFNLGDLIGRKEPVKGITINKGEDNRRSVVCEVKMAYGENMYDVGLRLQRHVKQTIEKMTGLVVDAVDVKIVGILPADKAGRETGLTAQEKE